MTGGERRIFRFGVFEADASSGELRKAGRRIRLQDQPFQVLMVLLTRSGEVVTRDELRQKLWPSDTFVDFDHSLNTVINKIRDALGDSAANPIFIETLARRGYRFVSPVESVAEGPNEPVLRSKEIHPTGDIGFRSGFGLTRAEQLPSVPDGYVRGLFLLIQIMYLIFYLSALGRIAAAEDLLERASGHPAAIVALIASAAIGIPVRLYLISAISFDVKDLSRNFLKLFPGLLILDELWALAPFLLTREIGTGLALGITAALIYVPFAQRTLVLMRLRTASRSREAR